MWSFSVSELAIPGVEVGRISASDTDVGENARLKFTILEGETGDTFNITGVNQEAVIAVDYESRSSYSFSVEVMNPIVDPRFLRRGPFKDRASVRVAVLDADEPPRFSRTSYLMDVSENCPPACTAGRVSAMDPDTGFSIDPQSDPETLFHITPDSGLITTAMELDREREHWHNITIIATQRDNPSQVSRVLVAIETLDLNDNPPELDRQYTTAMWTVEQSYLPSPGLSTAALLVILACMATLLAVTGLSLSLRCQKRDSLSPLEEDDVRENIITYDDEGGGEADTAAFDIAALQSAPHNSRTRVYRTRYSQHSQDKAPTYSWALDQGVDPNYPGPGGGALYGRLCYSSHTLPVLCRGPAAVGPAAGGQFQAGTTKPGYRSPGGDGNLRPDHSLVIQNQAAVVGTMEMGAVYVSATELSTVGGGGSQTGSRSDSRDGMASQSRVSTSDKGTPSRTAVNRERGGAGGEAGGSSTMESSGGEDKMNDRGPDGDWVQSKTLPRDHNLVLTRSGSVMGQGAHGPGSWACDSATLPLAGRRSSRGPQSPKRGGPAGAQGEAVGQRDYAATLGRGGLEVGRLDKEGPEGAGLLLSGGAPTAYPEKAGYLGDWRDCVGLGGYVLARRDISPQMLPIPGQARGLYGRGTVMGFGGIWVPGMEPGVRGMAPGSGGGGPSLALRVGEFLRMRLAQVTFDPTQPPYDSVQVYGLEGSGSRAGSLSSLESEVGNKDDWVSGLEDWGPQFHSLGNRVCGDLFAVGSGSMDAYGVIDRSLRADLSVEEACELGQTLTSFPAVLTSPPNPSSPQLPSSSHLLSPPYLTSSPLLTCSPPQV
ncbi:hypothetical protein NHX12_004156 [Muraenolepis orangiensis]|uniref:Cadherin domain-containing protein n=1 Tax=Muraenolepis orangiensis TaxID=630683 RepID=A0A9Q0IFA1_9TELE|nr:hypothetical protein NHX12_004156 [Muraenolepis orangiensis]